MTLLLVVKTFATSDKYLYFAFGTVSCKEFILKYFAAIEVQLARSSHAPYPFEGKTLA